MTHVSPVDHDICQPFMCQSVLCCMTQTSPFGMKQYYAVICFHALKQYILSSDILVPFAMT